MKKKSLIIAISFLSIISFGQISTTKIADKKEDIESPKIGEKNYLEKNPYGYLNTDLYLPELEEKDVLGNSPCGYSDFFCDKNGKIVFKPVKCIYFGNYSSHDELKNKYFTVVNVYKVEKDKYDVITKGEYAYYLEIVCKENNDTIYYKYRPDADYSFPFISVPYAEKMSVEYKDKSYVTRGRNWISSQDEKIYDIKTGLAIDYSANILWKCIDVSVVNRCLAMILENNKKETTYFPISMLNSNYFIFPKSEADKYLKKFGFQNWKSIIGGEVNIGMTKEMCELSWGEPDNINETITANKKSEQWVYSNNYLYFTNGILTAIQ